MVLIFIAKITVNALRKIKSTAIILHNRRLQPFQHFPYEAIHPVYSFGHHTHFLRQVGYPHAGSFSPLSLRPRRQVNFLALIVSI
jgi:hypothetical protein